LPDLPIDSIAELDTEETIQAISNALQSGGHEVILLEADNDFIDKLRASHPEIVFNIAEGLHGDCRESQVPAICEFFGIPYTGSSVLTLSTCLNKARTNEVLSYHDVMVPPFQMFNARDDILQLKVLEVGKNPRNKLSQQYHDLIYPLIIPSGLDLWQRNNADGRDLNLIYHISLDTAHLQDLRRRPKIRAMLWREIDGCIAAHR
jgi:hypothetical protein